MSKLLLFVSLALASGLDQAPSTGLDSACIATATAKAQAIGRTQGEQQAIKHLNQSIQACSAEAKDSTFDAWAWDESGKCGLFIFTNMSDTATNTDARSMFQKKCQLKYEAGLCNSITDKLFEFKVNEDAFAVSPGDEFCLAAESLASAHYYHEKDPSGNGGASLLQADGEMESFPGDATVLRQTSEGNQQVTLRELRVGDLVQTADIATGQTFFTKVLFDWHSEYDHALQDVQFMMLVHSSGSLNVTKEHYLATDDGRFVPAKHIKVGDKLLVQKEGRLSSSEVTAINQVNKQGMYAPVTWNGQLLVDGVHASSYLTPLGLGLSPALLEIGVTYAGWDTFHSMIHIASFPIRLAHALGLPAMLEKISVAPGVPWLLCSVAPCDANIGSGGRTVPRYVTKAVSFFDGVISELIM
jgi:hypothetical protein